MKKQKDIVCIAFPTWGGNYVKSTVELFKIISKTDRRTLYIDYQPTLLDILKSIDLLKKSIFQRSRKNHNATIITPYPSIPINWLPKGKLFSFLRKINNGIYRISLTRHRTKPELDSSVFIHAFNPIVSLDIIKTYPKSKHIYYCYDEIRYAPWIAKHGSYHEKPLIKLVNRTIVTSQGLYNSKSKLSTKTFVVKNGVDFETFQSGYSIQKNKKKVVGYIGSIDNRLDIDLLKKIIVALPYVKFVFIGRVVHSLSEKKLAKFPNVIIKQPLKPVKLALELKNFHFGIIPFIKNEFTKNIYPLKINEYLAAGLPIISTNFADLEDFKKNSFISDSPEKIINFLKRDDLWTYDQMKSRQEFAEKNSWNQRALNEFLPLIDID